ncbi:hypothetical protein GGR53DRAFT_69354 [Hypoxylon sp. FL1150]|nr:hypothetical protein GGR53DRAFT_69354 [Hypoxylon sp. FL1150]
MFVGCEFSVSVSVLVPQVVFVSVRAVVYDVLHDVLYGVLPRRSSSNFFYFLPWCFHLLPRLYDVLPSQPVYLHGGRSSRSSRKVWWGRRAWGTGV